MKREKKKLQLTIQIDEQLVTLNTYHELAFSIMDFNRQKPVQQQQRRSIVEGMARTGIIIDLENHDHDAQEC